jgi:hypothetical protein
MMCSHVDVQRYKGAEVHNCRGEDVKCVAEVQRCRGAEVHQSSRSDGVKRWWLQDAEVQVQICAEEAQSCWGVGVVGEEGSAELQERWCRGDAEEEGRCRGAGVMQRLCRGGGAEKVHTR